MSKNDFQSIKKQLEAGASSAKKQPSFEGKSEGYKKIASSLIAGAHTPETDYMILPPSNQTDRDFWKSYWDPYGTYQADLDAAASAAKQQYKDALAANRQAGTMTFDPMYAGYATDELSAAQMNTNKNYGKFVSRDELAKLRKDWKDAEAGASRARSEADYWKQMQKFDNDADAAIADYNAQIQAIKDNPEPWTDVSKQDPNITKTRELEKQRDAFIATNTQYKNSAEDYAAVMAWSEGHDGSKKSYDEALAAYNEANEKLKAVLPQNVFSGIFNSKVAEALAPLGSAISHVLQVFFPDKDVPPEVQQLVRERDKAAAVLQYAEDHQYDEIPLKEDFDLKADVGRIRFQEYKHQQAVSSKEGDINETLAISNAAAAGGGAGQVLSFMRMYQNDTRYKEPDERWTDEEEKTFMYLFAEDAENNFTTNLASEYALKTNNRYNSEAAEKKDLKTEEFATRSIGNGVLTSLGSVPANLIGGFADYANMSLETAARGAPYESQYTGTSRWGDTVRGSISQELNQYGTIPEGVPVIGGKGLGDAYQLSMSMVESAIAVATGNSMSAVMFFGPAAASGTRNALQRGLSPEKALQLGMFNGIFEVMCEEVSLDKLVKQGSLSDILRKGVWKTVFVQGAIEGSEEFATTFLNTMADLMSNKDESEFYQNMYAKMANGMSYEEAVREARKEWLSDLMYDALGGFISGGFMTGGRFASQLAPAAMTNYNGNSQALLDSARAVGDQSRSAQMADRYQNRVNRKGSLSNLQAFQLQDTVATESNEADRATLLNVVEQRLQDQSAEGLTDAEAKRMAADIVNRALNPETANTKEFESDLAKEVYEDLAQQLKGETKTDSWVPTQDLVRTKVRDTITTSLKNVQVQGSTEQHEVKKATMVDGKLKLTVEQNGQDKEYSLDELNLSEDQQTALTTLTRVLGQDAAAAYNGMTAKNLTGTTESVLRYAAAFASVRDILGRNNVKEEAALKSPFRNGLTDAQTLQALKIGQKLGPVNEEQTTKSKRGTGKITLDGGTLKDGTVLQGVKNREEVENSVRFKGIQTLAEALGVDVNIYQSRAVNEEGDLGLTPYGAYEDGVVWLDWNAGVDNENKLNGDTEHMIFLTMSHELTHFLEQNAPEEYKALRDLVTEYLAESEEVDFNDLVKTKLKQQPDLDYDRAVREVIADACETMLSRSTVVEQIANENPGLFQRIWTFVKDFFDSIRSFFETAQKSPHTDEAKAIQEVADKVSEVWDRALKVAVESRLSEDERANIPTVDQVVQAVPDVADEALTSQQKQQIVVDHVQQEIEEDLAEVEAAQEEANETKETDSVDNTEALEETAENEADREAWEDEQVESFKALSAQEKIEWILNHQSELARNRLFRSQITNAAASDPSMHNYLKETSQAYRNDLAKNDNKPSYGLIYEGINNAVQDIRNSDQRHRMGLYAQEQFGIPAEIAESYANLLAGLKFDNGQYDITEQANRIASDIGIKRTVGNMDETRKLIYATDFFLQFDSQQDLAKSYSEYDPKNNPFILSALKGFASKNGLRLASSQTSDTTQKLQNETTTKVGQTTQQTTETTQQPVQQQTQQNTNGNVQNQTSSADSATRRQADNILISNIVRAARNAGIDLREYYNTTADLNAFNLSPADLRVVVDALAPVVNQLKAKGDTVAEKFLDRLADHIYDVKPETVQYSARTQKLSDVEKRAVKQFGTTKDFAEAGYILADGRMLRFTDSAHNGERYMDHRAIGAVYGVNVDLTKNRGFNKESADYLESFINDGNIRLDAGDPDLNMDAGIQLSGSVQLTSAQEQTIRDFINWKIDRDASFTPDEYSLSTGPVGFRVEFGGNATYFLPGTASPIRAGLDYEGGQINADRIISDIRHYYETGETRAPSVVAQFHSQYSARTDAKSEQEISDYSMRTGEKSDRDLLLDANEASMTDAEKRARAEYKAKADVFRKRQQAVMTDIDALDKAVRAGNAAEANKLRTRLTASEKKMSEALAAMTEAERGPELREILRREREIQRMRISARFHDSQSRRELRQRIDRLWKDLNKRITNPTEKKRIPVELMQQAIDVLEAINMDTTREGSQNGQKLRDKLNELRARYAALKNDNDFRRAAVYDPQIAEYLDRMIELVGDTPINRMSTAQLTAVFNVLKALDHTARHAVKLQLRGQEVEAYEVSKHMTEETRSVSKKMIGPVQSFFNAQLSPARMFNRFGGYTKNSYWSQIYEMLDDGQLKQTQLAMEGSLIFEDLLQGKDYDRFFDPKNTVDIGLKDENGNAIPITHGMMVALYMHLQNEQNARHVAYGGLTIPALRDYYSGRKVKGSENAVRVGGVLQELAELNDRIREEEDANVLEDLKSQRDEIAAKAMGMIAHLRSAIESKLTEYDRQWIAASRELFDGFSKRVLNETTMDVYGFKRATVDNYMPIWVDGDFLNSPFESVAKDMSLENAGFMKERVDSSKPIRLADISDVTASQIRKVSQYCGLMPVIRSFNKVWGKTQTGYRDSLQKAVHDTFGQSGIKYIENLMADLNGARGTEDSALGEFLNRMRGHMAQASLTLSLRTALGQTASYPTAAAVLGWDALNKALVHGGKGNTMISRADQELIRKWSPLLYYRMKGYSMPELGDIAGMNSKWDRLWKKARWATGWIQAMDGATVGRLWYAAEYYVQAHNKALVKGTDAYYEAVAKKFNEVVELTQPNYTTMQRPDILRNPNALVKQLTMFLTQRLQNFNIVFDACATYSKYRSDFREKKNGVTAEDVRQAGVQTRTAVISQVVAAATITAFKFLADVLLHAMNNYRDDDDELTKESICIELLDMFIDSLAGNVLGGGELYDIIESKVFGKTYYGIEVTGVSTVTDMISAANKVFDHVASGKASVKDLDLLAKRLGPVAGLPYANAKKIVDGCRYWIEDAINGELFSFEAGVDRTTAQQAHRLYRAYVAMDYGQVEKIRAEVPEDKLDDLDTAVRSYIKDQYKAGDMTVYEAARQLQKYGGASDQIMSNFIRDQFTEGNLKEKDAIKMLTQYAGKTEEAATKSVRGWSAKQETGLNYDDIDDQFQLGEITEKQARDALVKYGLDGDKADMRVAWWSYRNSNPGTALTDGKFETYWKNYKPIGLTPAVYEGFLTKWNAVQGTDKNGDGKADSGSKKPDRVKLIDSLPISSSQKDELFNMNWSTGLEDTPWHK